MRYDWDYKIQWGEYSSGTQVTLSPVSQSPSLLYNTTPPYLAYMGKSNSSRVQGHHLSMKMQKDTKEGRGKCPFMNWTESLLYSPFLPQAGYYDDSGNIPEHRPQDCGEGNTLWVEQSVIPLCLELFSVCQHFPGSNLQPLLPLTPNMPNSNRVSVILLKHTIFLAMQFLVMWAIPGYVKAVQMIYVHFFQKCHISRMGSSWSPMYPEYHSSWQTVVYELTLIIWMFL